MDSDSQPSGRGAFIDRLFAATVSLGLMSSSQAQAVSGVPAGAWEQPGYASILVVEADEVIVYDTTPTSCIESERLPREDFYRLYREFRGIDEQGRLVLFDEGLDYTFRPLVRLPDLCISADQPTSNTDRFEVVASYFSQMYPSFEQRGVDWDRTVSAAREKLRADAGEDALWKALEALLLPLNDAHVFVNNGEKGADQRIIRSARAAGLKQWVDQAYPEADAQVSRARRNELLAEMDEMVTREFLGPTRQSSLQDNLVWGMLSPDTGYLKIRKFTGFLDRQVDVIDEVVEAAGLAMQRALSDLSGVSLLVVDLSQNPGGNDVVMHTMASFLLEREAAYRVEVPANHGFSPRQDIVVAPAADRPFRGRIALLISADTVSSAEIFALLLKDQPHVSLVGEQTRGAFSEFFMKLIPGGGYVGVPNLLVTDATGASFEGRGIPPDVPVPLTGTPSPVSNLRNALLQLTETHAVH